jgi:DNA-binding transcriptional regulator YiaG
LSIGGTNIEEFLMPGSLLRAERPNVNEHQLPAHAGDMQDSVTLTMKRNAVTLRGMREQSYLSEAIREARHRAGLSQVELAELLGVRQSSVSQWERGSTKPSTIHLLALTAALKSSLLDFSGVGVGGASGAGTQAGTHELEPPACATETVT